MTVETKRIYWQDPFAHTFEANVVQSDVNDGRARIALDATAFYPESGGQMADRGHFTLADGSTHLIDDVQATDAGTIHHFIATPTALEVGSIVAGVIERARRKENAALHTGQHILSSALLAVTGAETVSSRLGETGCNIDLDKAGISEAKLAEAEAMANRIVDEAHAVQQYFPTPDQLTGLKLRRSPKVTDGIRVVTVGDFDVTPCGGTHVANAAEVGLVRITHLERAKGRARVMFAAGPRARGVLFDAHRTLRDLALQMTCSMGEIPTLLEKLKADAAASRTNAGALRARLAEMTAHSLLSEMHRSEDRRVVAVFDDDASFLRQLAPTLLEGGAMEVVLAGKTREGVALYCARNQDAPDGALDCGAFVKALAAETGGRGGGKPERAEGRLPPTVDLEMVRLRAGA